MPSISESSAAEPSSQSSGGSGRALTQTQSTAETHSDDSLDNYRFKLLHFGLLFQSKQEEIAKRELSE